MPKTVKCLNSLCDVIVIGSKNILDQSKDERKNVWTFHEQEQQEISMFFST